MKNWKLFAGVALLVQSASFIALFIMLYRKKKSLAGTFLAIGAAGGIAGSVLVLKEMKKQMSARDQAALDACNFDDDDDENLFDECDFCYGDCDNCDLEEAAAAIDKDIDTPAPTSPEFVKDTEHDSSEA